MSTNDITGDSLVSKKNTDNYRDNYDLIFRQQPTKSNLTDADSFESENQINCVDNLPTFQ